MARNLATSEMVKNSIISEIEENLSTQRQSIMQDDLLGLCADRDCLVTPYALQRAINFGIDPRYTAPKQAFSDGSATVGNQTEKERILDESIIEDQFDEFLSRLELLESEDNNGMDDEELDFSVKERVLMIKVEKAVFDPLLLSIRTSRPALYQAVLQHPLIAGQQKSNKKQSKKEKKRDRKNEMNKEKEKVLAQSRLTRSQRRDKSSFTVDSLGAVGTLADLRASPEKRAVSNREMMAAMVAKTVAEGSLSGYLVAIALLLQIMKDERSGTSFASAIPIGNILSGLFERPDGDDESDTSDVAGASSTQNSTGSTRESPYLANPFHSYLLSPRDEPAKSVAYSDMSRGDIGSVDETRTEDTASQVGCGEGSVGYPGPHSDAGSTVGSTRAEQGTETASVDEDGTDDEQLAQALAMSMRGTVVNTNADAITAFEANMRVKSYSANSSAASSSGSVSFTGDRSVPPLTQHNFPKIEPLSTFGPFSSPEYWRVLSSSDYPDHSGEIPMVSLRHTVIALLTVIRAGADSMLGDDFSLSLLAPPDHSGSIFEARHGPTAVYVSSTPAVNPSPLLFLLLELLLDSLLAELKDHCNSCPGEPCSLKKEMPYAVHTANTPLTQNLLKERERKGKQTLFATQATEKPLTEEEIEMREWAFQRYFLVWAISSVLRVLRASFSAAKEGRCSNASLGLNIAGEESAVESTADLESRVQKSTSFPSPGSSDFARPTLTPVLPLALRLLQHVEACVGLGLDDSPTAPSRSVNLDEVLSPSLDRDALCTKLLRYPTQNQSMKRKVASQGEPGSAPATRYAEQHSLSCYRHVIRLTAIDCCVSGLAVFRPQQADRDSLLFYLLSNTPKPEVSRQPDYGPEIFGLTGAGGNDIALTGCLTYFLQEMCLVSAHSLSKARAGPTSSSPRVSLGVKIEASTGGDPSIPSVLKSAVRKVLKKKFSDIDLETILLNRLKYANLVKVNHGEVTDQSSSSGEEQTQTFIAPKNLIFWGELQLLHALQKEYMKAFSQSTGGSIAYSPSQICFNVRRCHQDIAISGDSKVVTHRNSKLWASISALRSFSPGSGIHEWALRIDKSDRGHVFVGIVTSDASMESYIGSDRFGWGIIGTRGLWHGRAKVASDFGSGFGNQSIVRLRLDTDQGTLSISTSDFVWAVAFENLPGVELFPAVSLYHRDDCISLVPTEASSSPTSPAVSTTESRSAKESGTPPAGAEAIVSYVRYTQTLCAHVDTLLRTADGLSSTADRAAVLSHPFIGLLLPSVAAAALESQSAAQVGDSSCAAGGYLAVQLIPYFTVMAKRLSSLQESVGAAKEISGGKPLSACGFIGNIGGLWTLHSSPSPCNTIAAQKYKLNIDYPFIPLGLKGAHNANPAADTGGKGSGGPYLAAARIAGSGRFSSVSVTLSGTQLGTRLKFFEKWSTGSGCLLDVRLSLCGSFFSGTYTDIKSGKSGDVEGCRMTLQAASPSTVREALSKSCLLCTMVCGKFAASLLILQCPSFAVPAASLVTSGVSEKDVVEEGESPLKRGDDGGGIAAEEAEGEDEEKVAATALEEAEQKEKGRMTLVKWLRSDLFSGGLPMDAHLTRYLEEEIKTFIYLQRPVPCVSRVGYLPAPSTSTAAGLEDESDGSTSPQSAAEIADETHSCQGLMSWWLEKIFPAFVTKSKSSGSSGAPLLESSSSSSSELWSTTAKHTYLTEDAPAPHASFISELAANRGAGKRVDDYVSHHVGHSALSKMGGGATQMARRLVVAALVKHSGCVSICLAEDEALSSGMKVFSDRPVQLLVDVWRSAQRCVEHAIRSKKGSSYDSVSAMLGRKAELLLDLTPNSIGLAVQDAHSVTAAEMQRDHQQLLLCPQLTGAYESRMEVPSEALEVSTKQLAEASEFLMSPLKDTAQLRSLLLRASFHTLTRIAGLKSFMLLFNRVEETDAPSSTGRLPALSAIGMQPAAIEYLFLAFRGLSDDILSTDGTAAPATGSTPPAAAAATLEVSSSTGLSGHYSDGLHGVSSELMDDLKTSFESMFEFITQLLSRCTWAGDRDGQCISLVCWGIRIKPDDHVFLNRTTGIFRVLQTVLDDARTSMALAADKSRGPGQQGSSPNTLKAPLNISSSTGGVFTMSLLEHRQGPYGAEMMQNTLKRLAQLVLKVVHSLASQVAFCKDGTAPLGSTPTAPRLQRMPSGPDTLSQSLFDMLYAELFSGWKAIIAQSSDNESKSLVTAAAPQSASSTAKNGSEVRQDDLLEGEQYIYRILRLLYFVSISKVCQRSLSSPKWLSLLLLSFGCGGFSTQRRTLRLLRRLLMNMDPKDFRALVPSLYGDREEMVSAEGPFDEDDINSLMKNQDQELDSAGERVTCTERLVRLFLEGTSVILSSSAEEDDATRAFHTQLDVNNSREALSTECVAALRFLQTLPAWREVIVKILHKALTGHSAGPSNMVKWTDPSCLRATAASLGVIGGYVDYLRVGGIVTLRPFCLISPTDTLASRLAGVYHCCAMLVSQMPQNGVVEVVLMERSSKPVREGGGKSEKMSNQQKALQYNVTTLSTALPVRAVRVNASDIVPSPDVPVVPEFTSTAVFNDILNILHSFSIPWLKAHTDRNVFKECESEMKEAEGSDKIPVSSQSKEEEAIARLEYKAQDEEDEDLEDEDMEEEDFSAENNEEDEDIFHNSRSTVDDQSIDQNRDLDTVTALPNRGAKTLAPSQSLISPRDRDVKESAKDTWEAPPTVEQEVEALQTFVNLSAFRAFSTSLQCNTLAYALAPESSSSPYPDFTASAKVTSSASPSPNNSRPSSPAPDAPKEDSISAEVKREVLQNIISLAVQETNCGGVCVIEAVEERWTALWGAYEAISRRRRDPKGAGEKREPQDGLSGSKGAFSAVEVLRTRAADPVAEADTFTRHVSRNIIASNPLLDAAASIGLFSHFGSQLASRSSATVDPATQAAAIAQMTDMGLPRDWCEVALRRCRYNVELAINMCFENGGDMPQIVAEDAIMQAAQASRRESESSSTRRHRPARDESGREELSGHDGREGREGSSAAARIQYLMSHARHLEATSNEPGPRHLSLASRIASDHHRRVMTLRPPVPPSAATSAMVSQLLAMGFAPHWCARAMHATNNDVDAALSWILSHREELVADGVTSSGEGEPASDITSMLEDALSGQDFDQSVEHRVNPLSTVSGSSEVRDSDLTCTALNGGFPSVGCRGFPVFKGKWYFELKVHTAGCVQVGWVDSAYDGGADIGEGVGDDSHSWAFDGWRMYLWHELSSEWGAKWSPGDVVGCAVDLDSRSMSFFLNGLGEEIDMGLAFTSVDVSGGLYPCASFNRGEVIQFNFGSTPFAFDPPEGYLPYVQHVHASMSENHDLRMKFSSPLKSLVCYSSTSKQDLSQEGKWSGLSDSEKARIRGESRAQANCDASKIFFFENSLEEVKGEREFYWGRRYFPTEDAPRSGAVGERPLRYPTAILAARIPRDREGLIRQIESVSRDLCILYCRMAVFRILRSFSKLKDKKVAFLELLMARRPIVESDPLSPPTSASTALLQPLGTCTEASANEIPPASAQCEDSPFSESLPEQVGSPMDQVLVLIRQSCLSTQRTKIYLQTVAMLHSVSHLPQNIGSVFGAGGAPMLEQLRHSMSDMLSLSLSLPLNSSSQASSSSPAALVETLLTHIQVDTANAVRRDLASDWRLEGGLAPSICKDVTLSDSACLNLPSLALAVWMTNLVVSLLLEGEKLTPLSEDGQGWMVQLARYWSFALRSPSLPVKTCALKMLSAIVSSCPQSPDSSLTARVIAEIPTDRLRLLSQVRLAKERGSLPVCSEFLQALLELVAVASEGSVADADVLSVPIPSACEESASHKSETADEDADSKDPPLSNDNWEALSGRLFSDEGWETWTGHVLQRNVSEIPAAIQRLQERQELPPELMPGCKVCRKRVHSSKEGAAPVAAPLSPPPAVAAAAAAAAPSECDEAAAPVSPPGLVSPIRRPLGDFLRMESEEARPVPSLLGDGSPGPQSAPKAAKPDLEDQLGTVLKVCAWTNHPPGSARLIKWDDVEEPELVRWDADDGTFDVTHVKLKSGKISTRYSQPHPRLVKIANRFFGLEITFGVILRIKREKAMVCDGEGVTGRFRGVMEWPDFAAVIRVSGFLHSDGSRTITEEALISGSSHTGWDTRFAQSSWRAGTTYKIGSPSSPGSTASAGAAGAVAGARGPGSAPTGGISSCQSDIDITDTRNGELRGTYDFKVQLADKMVNVTGDLYLQQSRLFLFDEKNSYYNITVSSDKMTVAKNGGSGQACAFGSVGFSCGVHYWEFKIEQADVGSIFLGVAEKPGVIGSSQASRFGRWVGSGLANHRASFRSSSPTTSDRLSVYGDHFHTGDTVGVLLDMNRGRLSFYLDGLKYGQHTIADLGEAFDGLTSPSQVKRRTMFPIVGLSKSQDRIAITPRWLSSVGTDPEEEVRLVQRAHQLLAAWSATPASSSPPPVDSSSGSSSSSSSSSNSSSVASSSGSPNILHTTSSWLFREAFSDWKRWKSARYIRVRSRCQAAGPMVAVDVTPRACVEACIRLGLPYALLRGDRVLFSRSSGRKLDTKEEAVILGAYKGQLWYRLDSQQGLTDGGIMESAALAWSMVPSDMEGLTLLRRSYTMQPSENSENFGIITNLDTVGGFFRDSGSSSGDSTCSSEVTSEDEISMKAVAELPLPRVPSFQGGLVLVTYANGAVMRDGLEIDTSEVLCSVPAETMVYALEQRLNSSNVWRLRVMYGGHYGWISERMRGGSEEFMLKKVKDPAPEVLQKAIKAAASAMSDLHITDRVQWDLQPSITAAMDRWGEMVVNIGRGDILEAGKEPKGSFEHFCELASTTDGQSEWTVEMDMQLADFISLCASKEGSTPQNVSADRVAQAIHGTASPGDSFGAPCPVLSEGSLLCGVHPDRVVARASLLRVANQTLRYALPYMNMTLLEEKQRRDCFGSDDAIDIDPTPIPPKDSDCAAAQSVAPPLFAPPSSARRLRALRRLLFGHTKNSFFESVLEATATPTPLHQDEYEDPREIKTLRVNRVRATQSRLATISSPIERMRQTVFGQLHRELRAWPSAAFRRSYVGKGHGGQRRAFKVKFMGEGVNDYGGPYRAVFEQVVDELQADTALVGRKPSERALLPLLMPSANRSSSAGANQDKFVLSTAPCSPLHQELAQFFGKLLGAAVRHNLTLALDLSPMLWRPLVRLPVSRVHLQAVDAFFANTLADVTRVGLAHEAIAAAAGPAPAPPKQARSKDDLLSLSEAEVTERELEGELLDADFPPISAVPALSSSEAVQPEEWVDLNFSVYLPDGTRMPLVSGGEDFPVTLDNWREYVQLAERVRLREGFVMYKVLRDGLSSVLPAELLPLFTPQEIEQLVSGTSTVDVALLRQCTDYEDLSPDSQLVRNFWEVLEGMTPDQHTLFLRFVWARSRMPASAQDLPMNFKLQSGQGAAREKPDSYLPHAQTCFFSLSLPNYSTKDILRAKLLYAINNSPTMDADVRLHSAEGWADS